jgi:hypothetical protein
MTVNTEELITILFNGVLLRDPTTADCHDV